MTNVTRRQALPMGPGLIDRPDPRHGSLRPSLQVTHIGTTVRSAGVAPALIDKLVEPFCVLETTGGR